MPILSGKATVTSIELAQRASYFDLPWPEYGRLLAVLIESPQVVSVTTCHIEVPPWEPQSNT